MLSENDSKYFHISKFYILKIIYKSHMVSVIVRYANKSLNILVTIYVRIFYEYMYIAFTGNK